MLILFLLDFVSCYGLQINDDGFVYYKSTFEDENGQTVLSYSPMIAENSFNSFPSLHKSVLNSDFLEVSMHSKEAFDKDNHYNDFSDLIYNSSNYVTLFPPAFEIFDLHLYFV